MSKYLEISTKFGVPRRILYQAFTDIPDVMKWSQGPVKLELKQGGEFEIFGGTIHATFVDFKKDEKIVQKWRMQDWGADADLVLTFKEEDDDDECILKVDLENIPEKNKDGKAVDVDLIEAGWRNNIIKRINLIMGYPIF